MMSTEHLGYTAHLLNKSLRQTNNRQSPGAKYIEHAMHMFACHLRPAHGHHKDAPPGKLQGTEIQVVATIKSDADEGSFSLSKD